MNALCFDIDDLVNGYTWYWGGNPPHADYVVEKETAALLETLAEWNLRTTMFVPGYVAERFGRLVKDIAAAGHDIASHGGRHVPVARLRGSEFREDVSAAKKLLEDLCGDRVDTYKAPNWSITPRAPWAYDELIAAGYRVDNSAKPSLLRSLGRPSTDMRPFRYKDAPTVIPVTTLIVFNRPVLVLNGGLVCGHVPLSIQILCFRRLNRRDIPFNYYCHPYEFRPIGSSVRLWRHRSLHLALYGLHFGRYRKSIARLAATFRLGPLKRAYTSFLREAAE